jgi:hypothetical protein
MQTEIPYWLEEAYSSAFTKTDTGLLARPIRFSKILECNIIKHFESDSQYLDYGGGNGVFVRLMRDLGFNFYRYDKYAENLYANFFDLTDLPVNTRKFELATAIEVAEHFEDPIKSFSEIFSFSESLFFTTFLQPKDEKELNAWWYLSPIHGQHISFYNKRTLEYIALKFNKNLFSDNNEIHIMTSKKLSNINFEPEELYFETGPFKIKNKIISTLNRVYHKIYKPIIINRNESLMMPDCNYALSKVINKQTDESKS